jgi:hypothetical protein
MDLDAYFEAVIENSQSGTLDRGSAVVAGLEKAWREFGAEKAEIARWAAHFLADLEITIPVWGWITEKARGADQSQRIALSIGVFELLVEEPRNDRWEDLLFSIIGDRQLQWVFIEVYELKREAFYTDFKEYVSRIRN